MSIKVILAGPDEKVLMRTARPALAAAGYQVTAVVDTPEKLRNLVGTNAVDTVADVLIVDANLALNPDGAMELLSGLKDIDIAVILPLLWADKKKQFMNLPHLVAGFTTPATWPHIVEQLASRLSPQPVADEAGGEAGGEVVMAATAVSEAAHQIGVDQPSPPRVQPAAVHIQASSICPRPRGPVVRLGFHGARGGAGVSTAALTAARALAAEGQRVVLFDAAGRGDLHIMAGLEPAEHPVARDGITFFLIPPTEAAVRSFDAVIVDGGRERGSFNAKWVSVSKPLSEDQVRRLVGLEPEGSVGEGSSEVAAGSPPGSSRRRRQKPKKPQGDHRGLGRFISIELTS